MDLLDDDTPAPQGGNAHEFTVSELSAAVKRTIEGGFAYVRVRGEVSRVSRPGSGHLYFDLKDDRAVISAVCWKGQAAKLAVRPEEGIEVIATGRLTTFPGQSKYQLVVEALEPAGLGALMLMLEKLKAKLAAEGLFDQARKKPIPYLPGVIGVITSPSGAVIRDILHRLRDRFPRRVVIWPVAVQGEKCAPEVAAAIRGFNTLAPGGPVPRPDLIIVARGGGSIEDLWGFNDEAVARAAAGSAIPLISAVGHETDTTLIDFAADLRAPTPTAAAELAVPVRAELALWAGEQGARLARAARGQGLQRRQRLADLSRALGRPGALLDPARQRLDLVGDRLGPTLIAAVVRKRALLGAAGLRPALLTRFLAGERRALGERAARLGPAVLRLKREAGEKLARDRAEAGRLWQRAGAARAALAARLADRLASLDRTRTTLGYRETLKRGYAVVRGGGQVVTTKGAAERAGALEIEFQDGRLAAGGEGAPLPRRVKRDGDPPGGQGSLF
ncbi:MAG: exodeoxyribonuclease VII large subunit [Paracoccaceae bacterium]